MKNIYKFWIGLIFGVLITSLVLPNSILAGQVIKLVVNGTEIKCDVPPQNINGRVLVPARFVAEALGATVEWDGENQAVMIRSSQIQPSTSVDTIQGKAYVKDKLTFIKLNSMEYVSLRDIAELSYDKGYEYNYDSDTKTLTLAHNPYPGHPISKGTPLISNIESIVVDGKSYIEYSFYLNKILPLIK